MKPQIVIEDWQGRHNAGSRIEALAKENAYRDLSTICIVPTRGAIPARVVQSWMAMMLPMNQKFMRMFVVGMEVGAAYEHAISEVLADPDLSKWKYILTLEEDNLPPPDGLQKLYHSIDDFDAIGGLYWMKGEGGQPMCFGNPDSFPLNFLPHIPALNAVTRCNGLGMGFTLFKLDMFRKIEKPWFQTRADFTPGLVFRQTQDLFFFEKASRAGFRFAVDSRVRVGHMDTQTEVIW